MTYPSGFSMPGAFHTETTTASQQPLIFRPPVSSPSPSASAFLDSTPKRKRVRGGTPASNTNTSPDDAPAAVSLFGTAALPQHTPVKAYALAGTLDTTPGHGDSNALGESMYSDSDYRTALGSKRSRGDDDDSSLGAGGPTSLYDHSGSQPDSPSRGWGTAAITVVGGVVGSIWEFCKAGAFKGFYAGGGRGYAMTETGAMVEMERSSTSNGASANRNGTTSPPNDDATLPTADDYSYSYHYNYDDYEHRVPGGFPSSQHDDYAAAASSPYRATVDDTLSHSLARSHLDHNYNRAASPAPSIPAAKRRQTTHGDDLGRNWVLVNDQQQQQQSSHTSSTPRKISSSFGYRSSASRNRNYTPSVTTGRRISATPSSSYRGAAPMSSSSANNRFSYRPETPAEQQLRPPSSASYASPRSASPTKFSASAAGGGSASYYTTASTASTASPSQPHTHSQSQSHSRSNSSGGPGHRRRRSGTLANTSAHRRGNSTASAASNHSRNGNDEAYGDDSPRLDAEARHLANRRRIEERDADVRISAFNKRLQDMIRQGKEALGTTIEIDDTAGGDDWEDED